MKPDTWNKLLDLLHTIIMAPCRTRADADQMNAQLEEIRKEVSHSGLPIVRRETPMESGGQPPLQR